MQSLNLGKALFDNRNGDFYKLTLYNKTIHKLTIYRKSKSGEKHEKACNIAT